MKQIFSTSKQQILKICSATLLCFTLMGNPNTLYSQQSGNANDSIYDFQLNDGSIITGVLVADDSREVTISTQNNGKIIVPKYTIKSKRLKPIYNQNIGETTISNDSIYVIELNDGTLISGNMVSEDDREIVVLTENKGRIILPKYTIKSRRLALKTDYLDSKLIHKNPHPSRYFYSPSAFPLEKNTGYFNLTYFLVMQAQYGITDQLSVGVSSTFLLMPLLINAKWSEKIADDLYVSFGGQLGRLWWTSESPIVGLGFGNVTYGNPEQNVTLNAGYGFLSYNDGENSGLFMGSLCGNKRISDKISLMLDLFYLNDGTTPVVLGGPGLRIYSGKRVAWDIGIMALSYSVTDENYDWNPNTQEYELISSEKRQATYFPIPFFGITYKL
jgi:hypothetical protein